MLQVLRNQNHLNQREEFRMTPRFLTWITGYKGSVKGKTSFEGKMKNLLLDVVVKCHPCGFVFLVGRIV